MIYDNYQIENPKDSTIMPFVFSVVVHAALLAFLLFWQAPKSPPAPVGIEASFVGLAELEEIEGQIRENARLAERGDEGANTKSADAPTQKSYADLMSEDLARRQAEFDKKMAEFAAELDREAAAEQQALADELQAEAEQNAKELAEARKAYANRDEKIKENQKGLDKAREARDNAIAEEEERKRKQGGVAGSLEGEEKTSQESAGTGAKTTQGASSGSNRNAIIAALQAIIYRNWQVPSNASGERLQATIRVDGSGNVLSASISGGNAALKESLERAIMNSSPLSPVAGTEFRELKVSFVAK